MEIDISEKAAFIVYKGNNVELETNSAKALCDYCTSNKNFIVETRFAIYGRKEFDLLWNHVVDKKNPENTRDSLLHGFWTFKN